MAKRKYFERRMREEFGGKEWQSTWKILLNNKDAMGPVKRRDACPTVTRGVALKDSRFATGLLSFAPQGFPSAAAPTIGINLKQHR